MTAKPKKTAPKAKGKPKGKGQGKGKQSKAKAPAAETVDRPQGGQTVYTREIADRICQLMGDGMTLNQICKQDGMPGRTTVLDWARVDRDGFADRYARAREELLDHWADETIDIADDGSNDYVERTNKNGETYTAFDRDHVERSKLRVETRKWMLTKLMPNKYGDKLEQTHKGDAAFLQMLKHVSGDSGH